MGRVRGMSLFSLRSLDEHAAWLRGYLRGRGIVPAPGSAFDVALKRVDRLGRLAQSPPRQPLPDDEFMKLSRDAFGIDFLVETLRKAERWLDTISPEVLRVYRSRDVNLMHHGRGSKDRNVAWEILVGALCSAFARDVALDEPDVRCRIGQSRWGLAAKVLYSSDPARHVQRIVEGAKQIENADVDLGLVALNASTLVPHDKFFRPLPGGRVTFFEDPAVPVRMLAEFASAFINEIVRRRVVERLTQDRHGVARVKTRGVLLFLQTLTNLRGVFAPLTVAHFFRFREIDCGEQQFCLRFNRAAQGQGFAPATPHWAPR